MDTTELGHQENDNAVVQSSQNRKRRNLLIAVGSSVFIVLLFVLASWHVLGRAKQPVHVPNTSDTPDQPVVPPKPLKEKQRIYLAKNGMILSFDENGADEQKIYEDSAFDLKAVSPDGKLFLLNSGNVALIFEIEGQKLNKLDGCDISSRKLGFFSPNGKYIAFRNANEENIVIVNIEDGYSFKSYKLKSSLDAELQFTPDSNGILCNSDSGNQQYIVSVQDGSHSYAETDYSLNVSPDGQKKFEITYLRNGNDKSITISNMNGAADSIYLTIKDKSAKLHVFWHQDGKSLLVSSPHKTEIIKLDEEGTKISERKTLDKVASGSIAMW
jgi:hypothetical protein